MTDRQGLEKVMSCTCPGMKPGAIDTETKALHASTLEENGEWFFLTFFLNLLVNTRESQAYLNTCFKTKSPISSRIFHCSTPQ